MVKHMDDFDMDRFIAQVETLWASAHDSMGQGIEPSEQAMFLNYIRSCFERQMDQVPIDHAPRKVWLYSHFLAARIAKLSSCVANHSMWAMWILLRTNQLITESHSG